MRLILAATLILLIAIHCGTEAKKGGKTTGKPTDKPGVQQSRFLKKIRAKCRKPFRKCVKNAASKQNLFCNLKYLSDIRNSFASCGPNELARKVFQCVANKKIVNFPNTCPAENALDQRKPNFEEQLTGNFWWAILSNNQKVDGFFRYPCAKFAFFGKQSKLGRLGFGVSVCLGNTQTGACATPYYNFFGQASEVTKKGRILINVAPGPYVVDPTELNIYVHHIDGRKNFIFASSCRHDRFRQLESDFFVLSPFQTIQELIKNNNDNGATEQELRRVFEQYGADYDQATQINAANCKN